MMQSKRFLVSGLVLACMAALLVAQQNRSVTPRADKMIRTAQAFLETLSPDQKASATFEFADNERLNWHFIPRERKGLPLKDLEGAPLRTAHDLIASGLSEAGYDQAINVMSLEEILYLLEGGDREERRDKRDPQKYYLSIFGRPAAKGRWGWRVEGHHLSLNYTIQDGNVVSSTPEFFGANPGTVNAGPGRFIRVLGPEEDIARQILKLCDDAQRKVAWISTEAPRDLRGGGVAQPVVTDAVGITYAAMGDAQKELMADLLAEYLKNMPNEIATERQQQIKAAGMDQIHFAWWGSSEVDEPHYYVVQGPSFIIEYNNVQNSANHVHSIFRNIAGDFDVKR